MAGKFDITDILTDILKLGPRNLIGIDIGLSSVKVCELKDLGKGEYKLEKFSNIALPEGCLIDDEIQKHDEIVDATAKAIKDAKIKNKNVCMGIYGQNTISKRLPLATGDLDEIEDQVMWESEQYIPFGIDESTVAFHVIGENVGGGTDVLIAAARNDIVETFGMIVEDAGLKLKVVDLQLYALNNVFESILENELATNEDTYILLDFGAQKTNLVVYKSGAIIFTKEIGVGGVMITEQIQREMGLTYMEAEDLKIRGDENGNLPQEIVEVISSMLDTFFVELKKAINFFMTASSINTIENCYITGGGSLLPGLLEGLESLIGIKVNYLNPFDRLSYNIKNIDDEDLTHIATTGVVSIGLAMRSLNK